MKFEIDKSRIPNHIGIIMDGNGRYAQRKGLPRTFGHKAGADPGIYEPGEPENLYGEGVDLLLEPFPAGTVAEG